MKHALLTLAPILLLGVLAAYGGEQQEDMVTVTVPKSSLTPKQTETVQQQNIHNWVGIGKEVGDAVNTSLQAVTTQSNNFAQTSVGKLTVAVVIWKVVGDQAIHILGGLIELLIFVPIWLWSYRRSCLTRRLKTGKDTWQVVEYTNRGDMTPRIAHSVFAVGFVAVFLTTVFSY